MIPPKIMPVMGLMAPLRSGPLRAAGSIDPGKAISLTKLSFARNEPYILQCYATVRSRLRCFGTLDVIFKSTSASVDRPLHENRIIEAVADNTIRFQPEEVLAFGCDVSCLSKRQSRPALGGWPLVRPTRGTAAGMMKSDCRRKIAPALSPRTRPIASTEYRATDCLQKFIFPRALRDGPSPHLQRVLCRELRGP